MYARAGQTGTDRRRATAFVLAVLAHLLLIWVLLRLGPGVLTPHKDQRSLTTFSVLPDETHDAATSSPAARKAAAKRADVPKPVRQPPPPPPPLPPALGTRSLPVEPQPAPTPSLFGQKGLFAGGDIAAMAPGDAPDGNGASGGKGDSVAAYGPGEGPGGQPLYNAEWYREPRDAELAPYLPHNLPQGAWAEIACRMVAHYHVENCQSLTENPIGSGMGRGMRQAAWQFLVLPPRRGGKELLGTWVRIRITLSDHPRN